MKKFKKRAVFLDRDGTINYDFGYVYKFSDFIFRPHVIKGLRFLSKKKYLIFIVTNQAGIAKGKFKTSDLLFHYINKPDIAKSINELNSPGNSSKKIQDTFIDFAENKLDWHHKASLDDKMINNLYESLEKNYTK